MHDFREQCKTMSMRRCVCSYLFRNNVYCNKTIITFGLCNIRNNQGLGKCYQPRPLARLITLTSTLIILDITKNLSNNSGFFPLKVYKRNYNYNNRFKGQVTVCDYLLEVC